MFKQRFLRSQTKRSNDYRTLEERRMLAGNVRVAFSDGIVFMRGDNADNRLEAEEVYLNDGQSQLEIRGLDGTTINGKPEVIFENQPDDGSSFGSVGAFRVNLGGGNDFMRVEGGAPIGNENIFYGGPGDDEFSFYETSLGDTTIQTFTGDDSISFDGVYMPGLSRLRIYTLGGDDTVGISNTRFNSGLILSTGEGNDQASIRYSINSVNGVNAYMGEGDDFFGVESHGVQLEASQNEMNVFTGNGSDRVSIFNSDLSGVIAGQGGGEDQFAINDPFSETEFIRVAGFEGELEFPNSKTRNVFNSQIRSGVGLGTVAEVLALTPGLSTISDAFASSELSPRFQQGFFDSPPNYETVTVFAPTDAAFADLPDGFLDDITEDQFADILKFHVGVELDRYDLPLDAFLQLLPTFGRTFYEADLLEAEEDILTLLPMEAINIEQTPDGVVVNGNAKFVQTDIRAKNGVVHIIDNVLVAD